MPLDWQLSTTTVAIQGFPIDPTVPTNLQVLTFNDVTGSWGPADSGVPEDVMEYHGVLPTVASLPTADQKTGDVWFVNGAQQFFLWNGAQWVPMSPPLNIATLPEAPPDGQTYGRDGATTTWNPVLPLTGGTMLGPLILSGDPTAPLGAATMQYVQAQAQFASQFLGQLDATSNIITPTPQSGLPDPSPLPDPTTVPGAFVVTVIAGTLPSGPIAGTYMGVGDWLVSDGNDWEPIHIGSGATIPASQVALSPVVGGWNNVQQAIGAINSTLNGLPTIYAPIASPSFTGSPTTPTPPANDSSQAIANTSWVQAYVAAWAAAQGVLTEVTTSGDVASQ